MSCHFKKTMEQDGAVYEIADIPTNLLSKSVINVFEENYGCSCG